MALPIPRDALPEDNSAHHELQEGVLIASPKWGRRHQVALMRLASELVRQLPPGYDLVPSFEVLVDAEWPVTIRVPDLIVAFAGGSEMRATADEVLIAVEIIAPGSRMLDMRLKAFEYAEAGIPYYWVVDLDPPAASIIIYGLGAPGDGYAESQTATGVLIVQEPFDMRIDLEALLARGSRTA